MHFSRIFFLAYVKNASRKIPLQKKNATENFRHMFYTNEIIRWFITRRETFRKCYFALRKKNLGFLYF